MSVVDFKGITDEMIPKGNFGAPPPGRYECICDEAIYGNGSKGEYIRIRWRVNRGEHSGCEILDFVHFSEAAKPRLRFILKRLGWEVPDGPMNIDGNNFIGRVAIVTCEEDKPYVSSNGKSYRRVQVPFAGYEKIPEGGIGKPNEQIQTMDRNKEAEKTHVQATKFLQDEDVPF